MPKERNASEGAVQSLCTAESQEAKRGILATSVCRLRHNQMEQDPTEPHGGRSTFLLSSGGADR